MNVFYMVVLRFFKIHHQYGLNVCWERYVDFDVISNCTRELFLFFHTSQGTKFLYLNASSCLDVEVPLTLH